MLSCQPVMTKKRDKSSKKVGFSVKKRDELEILAQFAVKNAKFVTFWRHEKVGQVKKAGTVGNLVPKRGLSLQNREYENDASWQRNR